MTTSIPACAPPHVVTSHRATIGDVVDLTLKGPDCRSYPTGTVSAVSPEAHCYEVRYRDSTGRHTARISDWGWEDGHSYATFPDAETPEDEDTDPLRRAIDALEAIAAPQADDLAPICPSVPRQDVIDGFLSGVRLVTQAVRRAYAAGGHLDDPLDLRARALVDTVRHIAAGEHATAQRTARIMDAASAAGASHAADLVTAALTS